MKALLTLSAVLTLMCSGSSCSSTDDSMDIPSTTVPSTVFVNFMATLTPVEGITSPGTGSATLKMDLVNKKFEITVNYSNITPTSGHIHNGDGDIEIPFENTAVASSPFTVTGPLTEGQVAGLLTQTYFVNLHTAAHPNGEISGVLTKTGVSLPGDVPMY